MLGVIKQVKNILDKHDIFFWPDCGTLLFMIRDNKLDPTDIDLSIFFKDKDKLMGTIEDFVVNGFRIHEIWAYKGKIVEISLRKDGLAVDIFVRQKKDDYLVNYSFFNEFISSGQPYKYFKSFDKIEFDGETYNIPNNVEGYLEYYYGKDWRIPRLNWNQVKDTPCIDRRWL